MKSIYKDLKMEKPLLYVYCKVFKDKGFIDVLFIFYRFNVTTKSIIPEDVARCAIRIVREKSITVPRENLWKDE